LLGIANSNGLCDSKNWTAAAQADFTYGLQSYDQGKATAVEAGHFPVCAVNLNIIDLHASQGRHHMLDHVEPFKTDTQASTQRHALTILCHRQNTLAQ
jgi:hypothetical protein